MTNRSSNSSATSAGEALRPRGWVLASIVAGLLLTLALSALDATIVGTALPRIAGDLHGFGQYSWVVTAYLITSELLPSSLSTKKIASWCFSRFV